MEHGKVLKVFPILAVIAVYPLWILMLRNGTLEAMGEAVHQQRFGDGTPLRTVYTGFTPIDYALSTLVAFTYYPLNGDDQKTRLLYIDILSTLQTGHLWCLVESLRLDRKSKLLAMPAVWGLLWNGFGAAIILPIYAFVQLQNQPQRQDILPGNAKALIPALVIASYLPSVLAVAAPLVTRNPYDHQIIIGYFQMTPLALTAVQYLLYRLANLSKSKKPTSDLLWVRGAFAFAGVASSITHIYAVGCAILSKDIHTSIYFSVSNAQVTAANVDKIALGAALFLQWDCVIINICTVIWGAVLVRDKADVNIASLTLGLVLMSLLLSPGAIMSFVFCWREGRIRDDEARRQRKQV